MCFVLITEQTVTCATCSINCLVFITEMKSVYSAVRSGALNRAVCKGLNSSTESKKKILSNELERLWQTIQLFCDMMLFCQVCNFWPVFLTGNYMPNNIVLSPGQQPSKAMLWKPVVAEFWQLFFHYFPRRTPSGYMVFRPPINWDLPPTEHLFSPLDQSTVIPRLTNDPANEFFG